MNVSLFWQKLQRCKTLRELQALIRGERGRREATPEQPPRFIHGAPVEVKGWKPTKTMTIGEDFFTSEAYMRTYSRADWRVARGGIDLFLAKLVEALRRRGVPMYVHTVWRSPAEQWEAYRKSASQTPPPEAAHVQGYAGDVVHAIFQWDLSDHEWFLIGQIGKAVARQLSMDIEWGGDWGADWDKGKRGWDPAHWQRRDWRDLPQLSLGELESNFPKAVRRSPRAILARGPKG